MILMGIVLAALAGCAGLTPQQQATNTLLATHDTIVNVEAGIKEPCDKGIIASQDCAAIEGYILQAKPAYNTAVDAQLVWLSSNSDTDQVAYAAKQQALDRLVGDALSIALKYGIKGGPNGGSK
jgi:hypothetical protein